MLPPIISRDGWVSWLSIQHSSQVSHFLFMSAERANSGLLRATGHGGSDGQCVYGTTQLFYKAHCNILIFLYIITDAGQMPVWILSTTDKPSLHQSSLTTCTWPLLWAWTAVLHMPQAHSPVRGLSLSVNMLLHMLLVLDTGECDRQVTWNWRTRQEKWLDESGLGVDLKLDRGNRGEMWRQGRVFEDELVGRDRKDQIIERVESRKEQTSSKVGGRVTRTE